MWSMQTKTTTFGLSISKPLSHFWPDHYWRLRSQRHFHNSTFSQETQIDQRPRCTIDGLRFWQPCQDKCLHRLALHLQVPNGWGLEYMVTASNNLFFSPGDVRYNFHSKHWWDAWPLLGLLLHQSCGISLLCIKVSLWHNSVQEIINGSTSFIFVS